MPKRSRQLLVTSTRLELLMKRTHNRNLSDDIRHWAQYDDQGATFFHIHSRKDRANVPPDSAAAMDYYVAYDSQKLQYLA